MKNKILVGIICSIVIAMSIFSFNIDQTETEFSLQTENFLAIAQAGFENDNRSCARVCNECHCVYSDGYVAIGKWY
jgi:hypothetical protein